VRRPISCGSVGHRENFLLQGTLWYIFSMGLQGRHKSLDKHVKHSVAWIEKISSVTKVVLGFSEGCRHRYPPGHIRFKMNVRGGFKVNAYSGRGVTDIFIKIDPIEERDMVKLLITKKFGEL
jgi:hypothetical protein